MNAAEQPGDNHEKLALLMVGLPARGKTYIARKIAGYLSWLGHPTRTFNVGAYRRERLGARMDHTFFDPKNDVANEQRMQVALEALDDMCNWLRTEGEVAIYDATNSTRERRDLVRTRCEAEGFRVVFIESICRDPLIIDANVRETKLRSPDYVNVDPDEAVKDFTARIAHYEDGYEPLDDEDASFIKLIDVGRQIVMNRIQGYIPGRLVFFLMNMHIARRPIWLTRHGESEFNRSELIGGDPDLTDLGRKYATNLSRFIKTRSEKFGLGPPVVWTSTLNRAIQTCEPLPWPYVSKKALDEIDAGVCDGLTYAEIAAQLPEEFAARQADKLRYRYPRGESYQDVIQRLEPVIIEAERQKSPVLVVAHLAVLRALYAYLMGLPTERCPFLDILLHEVIELVPTAYGFELQTFALPPPTKSKGTVRPPAGL